NPEKKPEMVAVAIDKDKGSQTALKWAVDHLLSKGKNVTLLHVRQRQTSSPGINKKIAMKIWDGVRFAGKVVVDSQAKDFFLPFRCFCTRKDIQVNEVVIEDMDIARAICQYVKNNLIETLVVGTSVKNGFIRRFKSVDTPATITKSAPEFCTVYVIAKGKISSVRAATSSAAPATTDAVSRGSYISQSAPRSVLEDGESIRQVGKQNQKIVNWHCRTNVPQFFCRSPFTRGKCSYGEISMPESDISFVSSTRPSNERAFQTIDQDMFMAPRLSSSSDNDSRISFGSPFSNPRASDAMYSSSSQESGNFSWSSQSLDDVEAEMRRLKNELRQTMHMYSTACKEALSAQQKAMELHRWKVEEEQKLEEARLAEEAAKAIAEQERAKCRAALDRAEAAQRIAELEAQKRVNAEMKAFKEKEERKKMLDKLANTGVRYRRYTIEEIEMATEYFSSSRKIGEGGYGPVYKCYLDHTQVAVKVLRPDAAQGRSQFQQEVEVLSCIRHPNMVLLLGACPEYGCLVYEYMANGSLEDRLFRRGNTPVLSWQLRFKIAAEIATGLLFLHQTKPEPLVHRDLKPGNILLDGNFVSKISDVGLARLVPPSVADSVTQYRLTSTAGTFCYIDPEYQQTGMLGIKSDVFSLGVMLLQIITAKPPMGLSHHVERAIERGTFSDMLDPEVHDWPVEEALSFAKMALKCTELRRKDRPDLAKVVLPELNRLRALSEETMPSF
ncbi:hypothetical protein M569_09070, partial [Genlisea aurea]